MEKALCRQSQVVGGVMALLFLSSSSNLIYTKCYQPIPLDWYLMSCAHYMSIITNPYIFKPF